MVIPSEFQQDLLHLNTIALIPIGCILYKTKKGVPKLQNESYDPDHTHFRVIAIVCILDLKILALLIPKTSKRHLVSQLHINYCV